MKLCTCLLIVLLGLVSICSVLGQRTAKQLHGPNSIQVLAHRGAPEFVPEHTFGAYSLAIRQKVDYIEPDVVLTQDSVLICMHDWELSGTTDVANHPEFAHKRMTITIPSGTYTGWFANNFTLAEIKTLRVNQRLKNRDTYYNGLFQVPTLNETIHLLKKLNHQLGLNVGLYVEPKHPAYFESMGLTYDAPLIDVFTSNGIVMKKSDGELSKVIIECFESTQLQRLRPLMDFTFVQLINEPWVIADDTKLLYVDMMSKGGLATVATYADAIGPIKSYFEPQNHTFVALTYPDTLIGQAAVDESHRLGMVIHPWTARNSWEDPYIKAYFDGSEEKQLNYLYELGIDGIFSESAAAAYYVRQNYEQSFLLDHTPTFSPPGNKVDNAALPLMITIPILSALIALLLGIAVGRYLFPLNSSIKQEAMALLNSSVQ